MTAIEFLKKLRESGAIVSSGQCSEIEISNAQATDRFFVDEEGYGYVWRTAEWLQSRENAYHGISKDVAIEKGLE